MDVSSNESSVKLRSSYSFAEDMAIVNFMTTNNRFLKASGIMVWKEAEKLNICPGRPYLSMKERYRKVIVRNLERYNVDKDLASKIRQFMTSTRKGMFMLCPLPVIVNKNYMRHNHKLKIKILH